MRAALAGAVRRPVAVTMVVASVFVFGLISYDRLDLSLLPRLSYPTLTVRTEMEGVGPRDVDQRITEVLEKRLATASGLVSMTSVSRRDLSDITLEFRWDTDMHEVRADLDAKIDAATLPREASKPLVLPYDPNLDPILRIAVTSRGTADRDLALARRLAEEVERELKKLPGVAAARIRGGREREIAVHLDEEALRRTGISIAEVGEALSRANRNEAAGIIEEGPIEYVVRSVNELRDAAEIGALVVRRVEGAAVRIRDLGEVEESWREREMAAFVDGSEGVLVEVYKKADANLVAVARGVRERLFGGGPRGRTPPTRMSRHGRRHGRGPAADADVALAQTLREWVSLRILTDQSRFIEAAIREVRDTALLGGVLAVLVLYLFLRSGAATLIAGGVIGICVVAAFAPLFLAGVSLNIMSLGGLALGVGMLVDNAIVVLEAAARKREQGMEPFSAAVAGVADVAGAITASTLTTVCVFFPIVFVEKSGVAGQVFRDLALSVVFAILASLLVALFVIPTCLAHLGRLAARPPLQVRLRRARLGTAGWILGDRIALGWRKLRRRGPLGRIEGGAWLVLGSLFALCGRFVGVSFLAAAAVVAAVLTLLSRLGRLLLAVPAKGFSGAYAALERAYAPFLRGCLVRKGAVLALAVLTMIAAAWRAGTLSPDLIPESMTGEFEVRISFPPGFPLEQTVERLQTVQDRLRSREEVEWVALTAGVEDDVDRPSDEGEHTARLTVHLRAARRLAGRERRLRAAVEDLLRAVPDAQPPEFQASALFAFSVPVRVLFRGGDREQIGRLSRAAEEAAAELRRVPGVESVRADFGRGAREVDLVFDRDELLRHGLTA
ncbi:MAG: efflux RND transporter permease subunit [Planctomycetota bacterium]